MQTHANFQQLLAPILAIQQLVPSARAYARRKRHPVLAQARRSLAFELTCLRRESRAEARLYWFAARRRRVQLAVSAVPGWQPVPRRYL